MMIGIMRPGSALRTARVNEEEEHPDAVGDDDGERPAARRQALPEVVERGVLAAVHGGGGADHDEPDEEIARHLVEAVQRVGEDVAQQDLHEHGQGHRGEDGPAEQAEAVVEPGAPGPERPVRAGHAYLMLRMWSTTLRASFPAGVA